MSRLEAVPEEDRRVLRARDGGIPVIAAKLHRFMWEHRNETRGTYAASQRRLADLLSTDQPQISKAVRYARERGWLSLKLRGREPSPTVYWVEEPSE